MKTKLTDAQKKAKKAEADKRYREKKKAEATKAAPAAKKASPKKDAPVAKKAAAKPAKASNADEKAIAKDVTMVLKKDLRIFFNKKLDPTQSQVLKAGKEITLEETGSTVQNEDGKAVKLFRFRRGAKRVYYAVEPK
jgi:glucan-binding YG repeat protein